MAADVDAVAFELDSLGDAPQVPAGLQHDDPAPRATQQLQGRGQPRRAGADDGNRFVILATDRQGAVGHGTQSPQWMARLTSSYIDLDQYR